MTLPHLRELYERATKGEWFYVKGDNKHGIMFRPGYGDVVHFAHPMFMDHPNEDLIVALHNSFPSLLARLEALENVCEAAKEHASRCYGDESGDYQFSLSDLQEALSTLSALPKVQG